MSEEETGGAIVPVEQRTVDFYGDELVAVRDEAGTVWVPVRRLCEALGVDRVGQMQRIQRDPVLGAELRSGGVTQPDGRMFQMDCLPLKYVRAWLFGINANRVKPEIREKLIAYQREVIEIIDRAFSRAPITPAGADEAQMMAMRDLARQHLKLWDDLIAEKHRLDAVQALAEEHDAAISDLWRELSRIQSELNRRIGALSDSIRLLPSPKEQQISPEQKAAIKALVDDIVAAAQGRGVRLGMGRNDYPAVWDAFKRRFDLAKYDELTVAQYDQALDWLKDWLDRLR